MKSPNISKPFINIAMKILFICHINEMFKETIQKLSWDILLLIDGIIEYPFRKYPKLYYLDNLVLPTD